MHEPRHGAHRAPSHISKMVLSTVHFGPLVHPGWASLEPDVVAGFGA